MTKTRLRFSQQEVLVFAVRFAIEKYDSSTTYEQAHKALKQLADATDNLKRWLEENPSLVTVNQSDDIEVYPDL